MDEERELNLPELIRLLWSRAWLIAICAFVGVVIAFATTFFFISPKYEAEVLIYVNNSSVSSGSAEIIDSGEITAAKSLVDVYIIISEMRSTLEEVSVRAVPELDFETLRKMIVAESVNDTEVFQITVTDSDPQRAVLIANTLADILPEKIASIVDGSSVRVMENAVMPQHRSSPSYTKNCLLGGVLGFVLCCGVIILFEIFDDKIKTSDALVQYYEFPLLAEVPNLYMHKKASYRYYGYAEQPSNQRCGI